jgi:Skp family chaperone for outer membrane proteins
MKALFATLALGAALATGAFAQTSPAAGHDSTGRAISGAKYAEAMKRLPDGVADKIAAAREAAKAAKADLDKMKAQGKTPEEIQAAIAERKAAAMLNLQKALDALNNLPDGAKERTTKAKEVVSKRLEDRRADAKTP